MVNENIIPKTEIIYELKEKYEVLSFKEFVKTYQPDGDLNYDDLTFSDIIDKNKGYGPCIVGDISNCHCSKEELERQKALIELQREKEKLESERKQRFEQRRLDAEEEMSKDEKELREKLKKVEKMKAAWGK